MKKLYVILLVLCLIASCIPQRVYAAERTMDIGNGVILTEGKQYSFKNASSGWHMNVKGAGNANGTHVNLWPLDMSAPNSQCFTFKFVSTEEKIVMISPICASNKYLDVRRYGSAFAAGQKMCLWAADGDVVKNLVVEMQGDGTCYLTFSNNKEYCIGAASATAAQTKQQQLVVCKKNGAAEQRWILCDSTGEPLNKTGIYQATIEMFDAVLAGLSDTKEVFSNRNNWIDDDYHEAHLPQLIQYTEQMKKLFVSFYDNAYASKDNSSMRRLINEMQESLDGAVRALKLYQDTTQVKWFGGSTLKRSIEEVISWFDWNSQEELGKIMEAFEKDATKAFWDDCIGMTLADINSQYYTTGNISYKGGYKGQCTWYAYGRFYELTGIALDSARHARDWISENRDDKRVAILEELKEIQPKAIVVNKTAAGGIGHVMIIEAVIYENNSPQWVYLTECNWDGNGTYNAGKDCVLKKYSWSAFLSEKNPAGYIVKK